MSSKILTAVFPGTFDPITNGHVDLISRASLMFPRLIVAVAASPNKNTLFNLDQRVELASNSFEHLLNVEVIGFSTLMADFARSHNANVIVRGVRTTQDFEYERQLAEMNRSLKPDLETVFLMPSATMGFISSSIVKDVAYHNGDISNLVPKHVQTALLKRLS